MANLDQAIAFIRSNGNAVDQARLKSIIDNEPPSRRIQAQFMSSQRSDGSWSPIWATNYSSLDATCFRLAQAKQMGIFENEPVFTAAFQFLASCQRYDGSFEEDQSIAATAPFWVKPGNIQATLYLTANCSYWLSASHEFSEEAERGALFLSEYLDQKGGMPSFLQAYWLSGGLWYRLGMVRQVESVLGYLEARLMNLSANNLTWMISSLRCADVPIKHRLINEAITRLMEFQQSDGRWQSDDGESFDINTTLEALYVQKLCERL